MILTVDLPRILNMYVFTVQKKNSTRDQAENWAKSKEYVEREKWTHNRI